jgi:hypothetical protein
MNVKGEILFKFANRRDCGRRQASRGSASLHHHGHGFIGEPLSLAGSQRNIGPSSIAEASIQPRTEHRRVSEVES